MDKTKLVLIRKMQKSLLMVINYYFFESQFPRFDKAKIGLVGIWVRCNYTSFSLIQYYHFTSIV